MPQTTRVRGFKVTVSKAVLTANWITSCWAGKVYSGLQYLGHGNKIYHFVIQGSRHLNLPSRPSKLHAHNNKVMEKILSLYIISVYLQSICQKLLRCPDETVATKFTLSVSVFSLQLLTSLTLRLNSAFFFSINTKCFFKLDICIMY